MKNTILVILIVVIFGTTGWFVFKHYKDANSTKTSTTDNPSKKINKDDFVWGVTTRAFALGSYSTKRWLSQAKIAKSLGVSYVRIPWEPEGWINGKKDPIAMNKAVIEEIINQGMLPIIGFGENGKMTSSADPYNDGYKLAFEIASLNKGKVPYYQIGNEISAEPLISPSFPGTVASQYDQAKYEKIRDWIKGADAGIKKADPEAKSIVVGEWYHYAFFEMLAKDNVNYDIIGWDWFSDMGLMKDKKLDDGTYLADKIKSLGKPIILAEVGQRPDGNKETGFTMDEDKQSQFIQEMADWAYTSKIFKGFIVFELTDLTNYGPDGYIDRYGLVKYERDSKGIGQLDHFRKAYNTYNEIITKYSK